MNFFQRYQHLAPLFLRLGLALVFLWFGIDKFIHPDNWTPWIPQWMANLIPISLTLFMYIQGAIETLAGFLLIIGYFTRFAAFLSAATLVGVVVSLIGTGQIELLLRDAGLLCASISLLLSGSDFFSIDALRHKQ